MIGLTGNPPDFLSDLINYCIYNLSHFWNSFYFLELFSYQFVYQLLNYLTTCTSI